MTLRSLVPALAAVAIIATPALAEDHDVVLISGWSDNIFTVADDQFTNDVPGTAKDEAQPATFFTSNASIKVAWTVTPRLKTKVNLWLLNATNGGGSEPTTLSMREAFINYDLGGGLCWLMGKYISHLGWIAVEPTGLYRVRASNIGYTAFFYGNDVVGTALAFGRNDSPFSGSVHVTNGYFNATDAANPGYTLSSSGTSGTTRGTPRENYDMGYGLDLVATFGKDKINLEFADDPHSGATSVATGRGGNVFQVGLNATVKDVTNLTLGGEVIWRETSTGRLADGVTPDAGSGSRDLGYMLLANYSLGKKLGIPASLTLSGQQYTMNQGQSFGLRTTFTDLALALLTNPLESTNFGLNAEVSYISKETNVAGTDEAWIGSIEAIAVIP